MSRDGPVDILKRSERGRKIELRATIVIRRTSGNKAETYRVVVNKKLLLSSQSTRV